MLYQLPRAITGLYLSLMAEFRLLLSPLLSLNKANKFLFVVFVVVLGHSHGIWKFLG